MFNDSFWVMTNNGFDWANLHHPSLPTTNLALPGTYALYGVSVNPFATTVLYIGGTYGAGASTNGGASWSFTPLN